MIFLLYISVDIFLPHYFVGRRPTYFYIIYLPVFSFGAVDMFLPRFACRKAPMVAHLESGIGGLHNLETHLTLYTVNHLNSSLGVCRDFPCSRYCMHFPSIYHVLKKSLSSHGTELNILVPLCSEYLGLFMLDKMAPSLSSYCGQTSNT